MPRPLSIALIASLCLAFTARADDKPSPAVKRILDKAVGKVRANRQEFDKANKKPLDEARAELQELSTKLIKDGKTDEAGVVLKQVGRLEADVMKMANAPAPVGGGAVAQKPLLERLEGKWTHPNSRTIIEIQPSGEYREYWKADGKPHRQGQVKVMTDTAVEVLTQDGHKYRMSEAGADTLALEIWMPSGEPWSHGSVLNRIK